MPKKRIDDSLKRINDRYGNTLRRLADSETESMKTDKTKIGTKVMHFAFDHPLLFTTIITGFFMAIAIAILIASRI